MSGTRPPHVLLGSNVQDGTSVDLADIFTVNDHVIYGGI